MRKYSNDDEEIEVDGENLPSGDQETIQEFYKKLNQKTDTKQQSVMTMSNLEEDESVGYNIMRSKSQPSKIIIKKNDDADFEPKKKLVNINTFTVLNEIVNKINATQSVTSKLKILQKYVELYKLSEFHIKFISAKTDVLPKQDNPNSLDELHTYICEHKLLKRFLNLPIKTRKDWVETKLILLAECLMFAVDQNDNVKMGTDLFKTIQLNLDSRKSPWNEFIGFNENDPLIEIEDGQVLYTPSVSSATWSSTFATMRNSATDYVRNHWITNFVWGNRKTIGTGVAYGARTVALAYMGGWGLVKAATLAATFVGSDGSISKDGRVILAKIVEGTDTYGGHYVFILQYIDTIINDCASKHKSQNNWKWIVDNDEFVPYDECDETARITKECKEKNEEKKRIRNREIEEKKKELAALAAMPDGGRKEYKRSKKHLKKQLKEGQITKETYRSLKKSAKKLLKK